MRRATLSHVEADDFREFILERGRTLYRDMPWRRDVRPYYILVSEIMLQQTQVSRVEPKFQAFIAMLPDVAALSRAPLATVLALWSGLGYNRRARYLHQAAQLIMQLHSGTFPTTEKELLTLPGVGKNTAGAIMAYAYNQPVVFVETNIRTVYLYHYFAQQTDVTDEAIREKLSVTLPEQDVRHFYWSLMDYGSWLKQRGVRNIAKSKHYKKQSKLEGSVRQLRGELLKKLVTGPQLFEDLAKKYRNDERFEPAIEGLLRDGLIEQQNQSIDLTK